MNGNLPLCIHYRDCLSVSRCVCSLFASPLCSWRALWRMAVRSSRGEARRGQHAHNTVGAAGGTCESIHSTLHMWLVQHGMVDSDSQKNFYVMTPAFGVEFLIDILLVKSVWVNSVLSLFPPPLLCVHVESSYMCRCSSMWLSRDWLKAFVSHSPVFHVSWSPQKQSRTLPCLLLQAVFMPVKSCLKISCWQPIPL